MHRRTLLCGAAGGAIAGLAGCTGILGNGGGDDGGGDATTTTADGCSPPETDDLRALLPESGGGFSRINDPVVGPAGEDSPLERVAIVRFARSDGSVYLYRIEVYPSASAARGDLTVTTAAGGSGPTIGYVVVGKYRFIVSGESGRERVETLLARSPALSGACVSAEVRFAG